MGFETVRNSTFDAPPPGVGFTTVTEAVSALAISEAGTMAVRSELSMKRVVSGLPFHFTTELAINPVPFTVSVKLAPRAKRSRERAVD